MRYIILILGLIAAVAFILAPPEEKAQMLGKETIEKGDASSWVIRVRKAQYFMRGEKGNVGIVEAPITVGKEREHTLFFWGKKEELVGKIVKISGVQTATGEKLPERTAKLTEMSSSIAAAQGKVPLLFPHAGTWVLTVYVEGKKRGDIVLAVK
ncbi:hypothetical protein [Aneurinibacillus uraniidurans]|uniref:hypothetical protein n=1 Tax=Aneurinibacillus uraniidurans TaxID=2966586 RepID=UPI00234A6640|nr:hypothetical protein [Aneurinibacillus sp. B1]WCN36458.1 hypothetical protein PO771_11240 [Aneurinibacillus sp. B1]